MSGTRRIAATLECVAGQLLAAPWHGVHAQGAPSVAATDSVVRGACGAEIASRGLGVLSGDVRDVQGKGLTSVAVTVGWTRATDARNTRGGAPATTDDAVLGAFSDTTGHWKVCGVPLQADLVVRATDDEGSDERRDTLSAARVSDSLRLTLRQVDHARATVTRSALVVFSVEDIDGHALGGMTLVITPERGAKRSVVTDSAGRAILPSMEPGSVRVKSYGIGYKPGEMIVPLEAGRNTVPLILDGAHIPMLATVRVVGDREVLARHQEFEWRHRHHGATASITAEDIKERNPVDTWQMLTNIPALRVMQYGAGAPGVYAMSTRDQVTVIRRSGPVEPTSVPCWYRLMIDGVVIPETMPDLSILMPPPQEVHGIEVFAGFATIPPQYINVLMDNGMPRANTCGLIAVWTK